jgi:hypothetical protein
MTVILSGELNRSDLPSLGYEKSGVRFWCLAWSLEVRPAWANVRRLGLASHLVSCLPARSQESRAQIRAHQGAYSASAERRSVAMQETRLAAREDGVEHVKPERQVPDDHPRFSARLAVAAPARW